MICLFRQNILPIPINACRPEDIKLFLSHFIELSLDTFPRETVRYTINRMFENFKIYYRKCKEPQEALSLLESFIDYDTDNGEDKRILASKTILEISYSPSHLTYDTVLKSLIENHLIYVAICYNYVFRDLWKPQITIKKLKFDCM